MNLSVFPVGSTNIFPLANDTKGGQLMTEYNLKSRESVSTNPDVEYIIGHSFVHGPDDFVIEPYTDSVGGIISNLHFRITEGRAIVDGHYIESLAPIVIDMTEVQKQAAIDGTAPMTTGTVCVGLRAMYSTEQTMAGALRPYNADMLYEGIQVVILPPSEFILPGDLDGEGNPVAQDVVTAHLKLGEFQLQDSQVISNTFVRNPDIERFIPSSRIMNWDELVSDIYVTKTGLHFKKLYTFSGKGTDPKTGADTWCDSTDSLMIWDASPKLGTTQSSVREATFSTSLTGKTQLVMPHKQVPYDITNTQGQQEYYQDKVLDLPLADYEAGTSGTVDRNYTNHIKAVSERINELYNLPAGKQIGYKEELDFVSGSITEKDLPRLNSNWEYGDYLIVGLDSTVDEGADAVRAPSTMYMIIPGVISAYKYHSTVENTMEVPSSLEGMCIASTNWYGDSRDSVGPPNTTDPDTYGEYFDLSTGYHARVGADYFYIKYRETEDSEEYTMYYYVASAYEDESKMWSDAIHLTGQIGLATEDTIGGFYNVPETTLDGGYIFRDETGHLRLLDYSLLRSGVLAYQLGESYESPAGITNEEVQNNLDEYVNQRVAFANATHASEADNAQVIEITLELAQEEEEYTINIYDIDSRFNTSIYIHLKGTPGQNCTVNIMNCEKVRIDSNIPADMQVNLYNSNLYYDAGVIDRLTVMQNVSLWYERFDEADPNLLINDMTVRCLDEPIIPDNIEYWTVASPNDNHYSYALQSITFGPDGTIVGAGLYVKNNSTVNIAEGKSIISATFTLPQGAGLTYPKSKLTRQIKISGEFVQAYPDGNTGYRVMDTKFTALTNASSIYDPNSNAEGVIAFYTDVNIINAVSGLPLGTSLDCWEPNTFYVFQGVCI